MKIGNLEVYGVIYKITNLVNGKIYIGQTTRGFKYRYGAKGTGIERVYNYHISRRDKYKEQCNTYLINSIEKYGFENFDIAEIIDFAFSKQELNIKEKVWISIYNSFDRNFGYNFKEGGEGGKASKDSKSRLGQLIVCINTGEHFISYREASKKFEMTVHNIKKTMSKKFYSDINNINELRFKKVKRYLEKDEKYCVCCGNLFKLKNVSKSRRVKKFNNTTKYCDKCREKVYKLRKKR